MSANDPKRTLDLIGAMKVIADSNKQWKDGRDKLGPAR
jgi:hypothetical protein